MLWSRLFIPTLRDDPANTPDPGQRLLIRAGYIRRLDSGGFAFLPLARRVLRKIVQIVREELDSIGGQEVLLPAGQAMIQLAQEIRSHKQLPQIWYQFQDGLEACSLDLAEESRQKLWAAFHRILDRCELRYESAGTRIMTLSESGAETLVRGLNYSMPIDDAETIPAPAAASDSTDDLAPEAFHTPNIKSIAEIAALTGLPETSQIKSLAMMAEGRPVLALLRGDHQLSEAKLAALLEAPVAPATAEEIREHFGAEAGSLGPVGVRDIRILADNALRGRRNMIAGANRTDYHLRHVTPGEDFHPEYAGLRLPAAGDTSIADGGPLRFEKAHRIARVHKLRHVPLAHAYSMNLDRILFSLAEQNHDKDGLTLPPSVAPFLKVITPVFFADPAQAKAALDVYSRSVDALLDDRDERPGVKFKDADLIGIPFRINIGRKAAEGLAEVVNRRTKEVKEMPLAQFPDRGTPPQPETIPGPEQ